MPKKNSTIKKVKRCANGTRRKNDECINIRSFKDEKEHKFRIMYKRQSKLDATTLRSFIKVNQLDKHKDAQVISLIKSLKVNEYLVNLCKKRFGSNFDYECYFQCEANMKDVARYILLNVATMLLELHKM